MAKQLLIYESAVPVSAERHGKLSFEPRDDYAFSAGINAVPLMGAEFARAATEYAIVFTESGNDVMPLAVLGVRPEQNLYLTANAKWQAKYVPAFIRRYPFVFTAGHEKDTLALCVDDTHPGLNDEDRGQRLFADDGKPSQFTNQILEFLKDYQTQFELTREFCKRLKEFNLLEPMQAEVTTPGGEKFALNGFQGVARNRIRTLAGDALAELAKNDSLELLYLHLYSLGNFNEVMASVMGNAEPEPESAEGSEIGAEVS